MARSEPQVNIRLSADLKDRIKAAAEMNRRSINAELVARLEQTLSADTEFQHRVLDRLAAIETALHLNDSKD